MYAMHLILLAFINGNELTWSGGHPETLLTVVKIGSCAIQVAIDS